jgi:hypothetical protein
MQPSVAKESVKKPSASIAAAFAELQQQSLP